jgi:undecaprenyl-diphosphatase
MSAPAEPDTRETDPNPETEHLRAAEAIDAAPLPASAWARAAAVLAFGVVLVIVLLGVVGEVIRHRFGAGPVPPDAQILLWLQDRRTPAFDDAMQQITALGSRTVLTLAVVLTLAANLLARHWHTAGLIGLSSAGAGLLDLLLKTFVDRPRPFQYQIDLGILPIDRWAAHSSFPSGHSMGSMAIYLTLGVLLSRFAPNRRSAVFTVSAAAGLSLLIGLSRMYLGVHYPTDVVAGWSGGALWTIITIIALRELERPVAEAGGPSVPGSPSRPAAGR